MFTSAKDLIAKKVVVGERKDVRLDVTIEGLGAWRFRVPDVEEVMDAQEYGRRWSSAAETSESAASSRILEHCCERDFLLYRNLRGGSVSRPARGIRHADGCLCKAGSRDAWEKAMFPVLHRHSASSGESADRVSACDS